MLRSHCHGRGARAGAWLLRAAWVVTLLAPTGCGGGGAAPGRPIDTDAPAAPAPLAALARVEGWVPSWAVTDDLVRRAVRAGVTDVLFFHGTVDADGQVRLEQPARLASAVAAAHAEGARTWLTVTNHGASLDTALRAAGRARHCASLVAAWRQSRCQHLDLDYEQLTTTQLAGLTALVATCAAALRRHSPGARLGLTLQPADTGLRPAWVDAYRALCASPDVFTVRLMCYDYHFAGGDAGALCPEPALERLVATYRDQAAKVCLALPLYGYDWAQPARGRRPAGTVVTLADADGLADQRGIRFAWLRDDGERAARYVDAHGVRHRVAVPSLRTIRERAALAREMGIPAVALWHLGCADPARAVAATQPGADAADEPEDPEVADWQAFAR